MTFASILDPDQAWQNVRPDQIWIQIVWHSDGIPKKQDFFEKVNLKKKSEDDKKTCKIT